MGWTFDYIPVVWILRRITRNAGQTTPPQSLHATTPRHEDASSLPCCRGAAPRRSSLKASAPPSSKPGESWLSSVWVYDHDPRKRNAFVRPAVPASTPDRRPREEDGELGQHLMKPFSGLSFEIGVFSCYRSNRSNSSPAPGIPSKQKRSIRSSERDVHSSFWCCWYVRKTSFATVYVSPS